jgi:hypothetical protein
MSSQHDVTPNAHLTQIGTRYQVDGLLGRGGMATVYRVTDATTGRRVALKQLALPHEPARRGQVVALFEREFHALAQLSHPRVIEVYDYGVGETGPYYTMELLDGGDLRARAPLPWRQACTLLCGVCSSLALIHSRRLVHRDISPANIWCTQEDQGKLIDFGVLTPMGEAPSIVGTPAFVAPEVVQRLPLDGRTDLFSFGATLYFALTGHSPYPARNFSQLTELWTLAPAAPSTLVEGIPEALDALVMSLLCQEPAMRPRAAFEVMQRLSAIAGIDSVEPIGVSQAYLSAPTMVGRATETAALRDHMASAFSGRGRAVLIEGEPGVGRSRLLQSSVVAAKMLGATTLYASASAGRMASFAVAQALAGQLLEILPSDALASARASGAFEVLFEAPDAADARPRLKVFAGPDVPEVRRQKALTDWVLHLSATNFLAIAIDDVHEIDEASLALLATLARQAQGRRLFVAVTAETAASRGDASALETLAGDSERVALRPLTRAQTEELLGSLFGDAQNLGAVADGVHRVSVGSPRASIDLAKHLIDKGVICYESGGWTLPVRLDPGDLPRTAGDAIRERIAALRPLARWLAEAQAFANDQLRREDYRLLRPDAEPALIDRAISELVSNQVLVSDGRQYSLAHRGWAATLTGSLTREEREQRHQALAGLYEERLPIAVVRHLLAGGLLERGLDRLSDLLKVAPDASGLQGASSQITASEIADTIETALSAAETLKRPVREINGLRQCLMSLSVRAEDAFYWRAASEWSEQLKRDSGLLFWRESDDGDTGSRLKRALAAAAQKYASTPERDRGYRPDEAVRALCHYVAISIAIGSRSLNIELLETLPGLLEPFAPLSPVVALMLSNAIATCESRCRGQLDQARTRNLELHDRLGKISRAELPYVDVLRNAVAFAIGSVEARMGLPSATVWIEILEKDILQHVNALLLRKVLALQVGDADGAERHRRQAELLALQARVRQMFTTTVPTELAAYALAGDLSGVQQVRARIHTLAEAHPGWRPYAELAEGQFQQLRGNLDAARAAFERCIAMASPDPGGTPRQVVAWPPAVAAYVETLVGLGRHEEARTYGQQALTTCQALAIGVASHDVSRALALAEARVGDYPRAVTRLEALIAEQKRLGIAGLILGASYEARARIAIWAGDEPALAEYADLTAREYRHGRRSPLGARWEQLMAEARRTSKRATGQLADFGGTRLTTARGVTTAESVTELLRRSSTPEDRAGQTLKLLCDDRGAAIGYLYLVADGGLTLAASQGAAEPPGGLLAYLEEYFERELSESSDGTAVLSIQEVGSELHARPGFRDDAGVTHRLVLMTSIAGGGARHAGIAVFVEGERAERLAGGAELVAALTTHLIEAGDTRGVSS